MKNIALLALATLSHVSVLRAAPSVLKEATQQVALHIKLDKTTSEMRLTMSNKSGDTLGETCNTRLESDTFANFPIVINIDENGAGNITLGSDTFVVHEDATLSDGALACTRMYNQEQAFVNCKALVPTTLQLMPLLKRENCFAKRSDSTVHGSGFDLEQISLAVANEPVYNEVAMAQPVVEALDVAPITKRQPDPCDRFTRGTDMIGNGNPHQNWFHQQLSETNNCGGATCSVGWSTARSMSVGFSASATIYNWLSGGFEVTTSWESGNNYGCEGGPGQTVCLWYNFAHTAYTVQNWRWGRCEPKQWYAPIVLSSPNSNNRGGGYYCVVGTCRSITDNWWDRSAHTPGGPR